jgi:hypothetical protein
MSTGGADGQTLLSSSGDASAAYRAFQDSFLGVIGFLAIFGGFSILVFTVARWRGDPTRRLLLNIASTDREGQP